MFAYKYPEEPHTRRHGPQGYDHFKSYKPWLRDDFSFRCIYCLVREKWSQFAGDVFGADHFVAQVTDPKLVVDYENLVYACARCNSYKQDNVIMDPCKVALSDHIHIKEDGSIEALTTEGKDYVRILGLDSPEITEFRGRLIKTLSILSSSRDPDAQRLLNEWLGFPIDLPNLAHLKPKANSRPEGIKYSHHALQAKGLLPEQY